MPDIERPDGAVIHYEVAGDGPPLLLLAPDLVNSEIDSWGRVDPDPRKQLADDFTIIAMDQRWVGRSTGPCVPFDYAAAADDQRAVLDAAGAERAALLGRGIGATYALGLIRAAPERISAAVLIEPLGRETSTTRHPLYVLFQETLRMARADGLAAVLEAARRNPRFDENPVAGPYAQRLCDDEGFAKETLDKGRERYAVRIVRFRDALWPDETVLLSVPEDWLSACSAPLLVLPGGDALHPRAIPEAIAAQASDARLLEADPASPEAQKAVREFLLAHAT